MATRKPRKPEPGFAASPGQKARYADARELVIIMHPSLDCCGEPSSEDAAVTVEEAEAFYAELGEAIAGARAAVAARQAALREAAGRAIDAELDKILPRHG